MVNRSAREGFSCSWLAVCALAAASTSTSTPAAVIINELHYNPPTGSFHEFIELHNPGNAAMALEGWSFSSGVEFTFPVGAGVPAQGFVVIASDRDQLIAQFGLAPELVFGPYEGALDNGGEKVELSDASGIVVDSVRYDDDAPWDAGADGNGPSLERLCATDDAEHPGNWAAGASPTPLRPSALTRCPPPALPPSPVSINEILYHTTNENDALEEFVELRNNTAAQLDLKGYSFAAGIDFKFETEVLLPPGELVVVARNPEHARKVFNLARVHGPFLGQLANGGERLTLVDAAGAFVDSVRFADSGDWPVAADGLGSSLEKISAGAPASDPRSWRASDLPARRNRQRVVIRGKATSTQLVLQLDKTGECLIDNLAILDPANPARNFVPNGSFDRGIDSYFFEGGHAASSWDPTGGTNGTGALRMKARSFGGIFKIEGGVQDRISAELPSLVTQNGPTYELSFDFTFVSGGRGATVALSGSTPERGIFWRFEPLPSATPGRPNSVASERLPPLIEDVGRFPREPGSTDAVTITARVRADGTPRRVKMIFNVNRQPEATTVDLQDDGARGDGPAGDGVYGVTLPAFPHNTMVTFQLRAEDTAGGEASSPPDDDPTGVHGFYVNDLKPASKLPIYQILLNHTSRLKPRAVIDQLNCQNYWTASLALGGDLYHNIGLRMRGASVCRTPKPYLKLRFRRGREFQGQHKVNIQALWTDKSLLRERLSWELFHDLGVPASEVQYVRLHANGQYYGLFAALENYDGEFLDRVGLNSDGSLYKSVGSNQEPGGGDPGPWEKKTNELSDHSDLKSFIKDLHASTISTLRTFFADRTDRDRIIEYQLGQILIDNIDYTGHNHYLYQDPEAKKWMFLPWDLDLTFGKGGVLDDYELIPGFSPWFGTAVDGEFQNHLLDRMFSDAGNWYRRAYLIRLWDMLQERFTEEYYEARIRTLRDLIFEEQKEDIAMWGRLTDAGGGNFPRDIDSNIARVKFYVKERRKHLLSYIEREDARPVPRFPRIKAHDRLKITELNYNPPGTGDALEFIELWNPGTRALDLNGWSVDGVGYTFPSDATVAAGEVFILAKDPVAFVGRHGRVARILGPYEGSLDNNGETLRIRDKGAGHPATVEWLRYRPQAGWPRQANSLGHTAELTEVSEWRNNDVAENWRASLAEGGTPGVVDGIGPPKIRYHRGDANADGKTDLADVLATLGHLFLGKGEPACLEASDLNASGSVKLDDAIFLLRHLFQGGQEPIPFPGPGDCADVEASRCGKSNC